MKKIFYFPMVLVAIVLVQAQESDYAIVQRFQATVKQLSKAIESANTVQECNSIARRIDGIQNDYQIYEQLIDNAVYPESFNSILNDLRSKLSLRRKDLTTIETHEVRIQELEVQIKELSDQIQALTAQNEKLFADVQRLSQNIKRLTGDLFTSTTPIDSLQRLIVQLRKGLNERDALIKALVDSLFLKYDKPVEQMKEGEKKEFLSKVERYGIYSNIIRSLQDNIAFIEVTSLKGTDAEQITQQQMYLQSIWNAIAPKLSALYSTTKQKRVETSTVDSLFAQWSLKLNTALWRSLNNLFREHEIAVIEFYNGSEFVANLGTYIDAQAENRADESKETRYKKFTVFNEKIWLTELQNGWFPALIKLGHITEQQKLELEEKYTKWKASIEPATTSILSVVLLVAVAILFIVLIAWYWRQRHTQEEEEV